LAVISKSFQSKKFAFFRLCVSIILIVSCSNTIFSQKKYQKEYYKNGQLKQEGWVLNNHKIDYWKFFYKNGNLKKEGLFKDNLETKYWYFYSENSIKEKEGHFIEGQQNDWWLFYDKKGHVIHKCQLKNNQKNGYCLIYQEGTLIKASKFKKGKKINEWKDFSSFKKENSLSDLR
jgi:antitoxin component YwqK of YwqJK toxin-antitoxin module